MTKYVTKPHGLKIASDNIFFLTDSAGILQDTFKSTLTFSPYDPQSFSYRAQDLRTPAHQLCWDVTHYPMPAIGLLIGEAAHHTPQPWLHSFMDKNCPGWAIRPIEFREHLTQKVTIFFTARKHALLVCDIICEQLEGINKKIK
jgi:hypothetical protein